MKTDGLHKLQMGDREISIEMQYGFRKRLTLTVYPDQRVIARIPYGLSKNKVTNYLQMKSGWMIKHLDHFEQHPPESEKNYLQNEIFFYLGKPYKLNLLKGSPRIGMEGEYLRVRVKDPEDKDMIARALDRWYRKEAIRMMTPRFYELFAGLAYLGLPSTSLRFYKMKRRWGSCSAKHVITLNTELIKKGPALIDYVIIHEICHLKVPAHNKSYYSLLASLLPDWREKRRSLNEGTH